ncbi:hypothetical protein QBE55_06970 [Eubacteriales bacterium mix99]
MILFCLHARLYNWTKQQATQPEQKQSIWEQLQQAKAAVKPTTRYGKVKALKENAALFSFLQENGIFSMQELHAKVTAMQTKYYDLRGEIAATARQIDGLATFHVEAIFREQSFPTAPFRPETESSRKISGCAQRGTCLV